MAERTSTPRALVDILWPGRRHAYGRRLSQIGELRLPEGRGPHPVCVLLHGGYWRARWSRRGTRPIAADLARRGWATWNLEYRRVGRGQGGGWPATLQDVAAGIDHLADLRAPLDLDRVAAVGHSAGGQLAVWAAARAALPEDAPGAAPMVRIRAVAALAAVLNMELPAITGPGEPVNRFLGGTPEEVPDRYAQANPMRRLPVGVPMLLVHGLDDETIPVKRSRQFAEAARAAGDEVELLELPDVDHRQVVDPRTPAWNPTAGWLERLGWLGSP